MKHLKTAIWVVLALSLVLIVGRPVARMLSWQEEYGEAESLVQTIWPMSQSMNAYEERFGRSPETLEDLASFDPDLNLSALAPYDVRLSPEGRQRLFVRVNRRFAFEIDDRFQPSWAEFTAVLEPPKDGNLLQPNKIIPPPFSETRRFAD